MVDFTLRPLTVPERKYTYAQSSQLQGQTGNIGYLRGDFGSSGDQFYTTWFDTRPQWKSDEFKRDLDDVINALRSEEYGLLQSRSQMVRYGRENKESEMQGAYTTEFGFRADTEKYAFVLRCNPTRGDYNFYCLCYVKECGQVLHQKLLRRLLGGGSDRAVLHYLLAFCVLTTRGQSRCGGGHAGVELYRRTAL